MFFLKTPRAESVVAADDMAFLDRLWRDWSPGYDAAEDLRNTVNERVLAWVAAYR